MAAILVAPFSRQFLDDVLFSAGVDFQHLTVRAGDRLSRRLVGTISPFGRFVRTQHRGRGKRTVVPAGLVFHQPIRVVAKVVGPFAE